MNILSLKTHSLVEAQLLSLQLTEMMFAGGGNALTCLGCCGTWPHTFSQPLHATEIRVHNLEITRDVPSWFPRWPRAERLAEEIPSLPQHRHAKAPTGKKKFRIIMALRQAEEIPLGAESCFSHLSSQLDCPSQHSQPD